MTSEGCPQRPQKEEGPPRLIWHQYLSRVALCQFPMIECNLEQIHPHPPISDHSWNCSTNTLDTVSWVVCDCSQTKSSSGTPLWISGWESLALWRSFVLGGGIALHTRLWFAVYACVRSFHDWLSRGRRTSAQIPQMWFRRFVNPLQITVAPTTLSHPTPALWKSSSEGITPRWRILDVIASICQLFYSHYEVTRRPPLTSPQDGQLQSAHQSLSMTSLDT